MCLIIAILIVAAIIFMIYFAVTWIEWVTGQSRCPKIEFKSFQEFYNINPKRWELKEDHIVCRCNQAYNGIFHRIEQFEFTYIDYLKYIHWKRNIEKEENFKEQNKSIANMLAAVREDIRSLEERSKREKNEAIDYLQKILNNLRGDK